MTRGDYCSFYEALPDDPDFMPLTPEAKLTFFMAKFLCGASGIALVRRWRLQLADMTGYSPEAVERAASELQARDWLVWQDNVLWVRNGWRHNPNLSEHNANHRRSVEKHLLSLPRMEIVNAFGLHYQAPEPEDYDNKNVQWVPLGMVWEDLGREVPIPDGIPDGIPHPIPDSDNGQRTTDNGVSDNGSVSDETGADAPSDESEEGTGLVDTLDAKDADDWAIIRPHCFPLLRKHVWQGDKPPPNGWNPGREVSVIRNWLRGGYVRPSELELFLATARKHMGWTGPASTSWLAADKHVPRLREIQGKVHKRSTAHGGVAGTIQEVLNAA